MYVCRLGVVSFLLSDTLVSGFTTGAAIHVLTSQIKDLLGLSLPPITGNFKIVNVSLLATLPTNPRSTNNSRSFSDVHRHILGYCPR